MTSDQVDVQESGKPAVEAFLEGLTDEESRRVALADLSDLASRLLGPGGGIESVEWHRLTGEQIEELKTGLSEDREEAACVRSMRALRGVLREAVQLGQLQESARVALDASARMGRKHRYDSRGLAYESMRYGAEHWQIYFRMRAQALVDLIEKHLPKDRPLRILEVGCGTGLTLQRMVEVRPGDQLFGADFSMTMLQQANEKLETRDEPASLVQGNGLALPFPDEQFDLVYATRFIHQFDHELKKKIHGEMRRLTRPGGFTVVEFYGRSYRVFRYYTGRRMGRKVSRFMEHYPSAAEVRDIVGGKFDPIPLRVGASRLIHRFFGEGVLRRTIATARHARFLLDEYFVATPK